MKKYLYPFLVTLLMAPLSGCNTNSNENKMENTQKYILKEIKYEQTKGIQKESVSQISLNTSPLETYKVGDEISITTVLYNALYNYHQFAYYIADWGDGTWSYIGPKSATSEKKAPATLTHVYKTAGTYNVKTAAVDLSDGRLYGWSESEQIKIAENDNYDSNKDVIENLRLIASSNEKDVNNIIDSKDSYWKCESAADSEEQEWAGMIFDDSYKLSNVEVKFPAGENDFGSNIAIEYTTDFGKTWYSLPKYYYLYDYAKNNYSPIMRFPNPKGATLQFNMEGIVANGVRLSTKLFLNEERKFAIDELRAYGNKELLLYTSKDTTYNADLNNMWTIFGSAKTEPIVSGSLSGESTNQSPFRTGFAMIASTEWLEWTGLKVNWLDYPELKQRYLNQLMSVKYGPDGWSDYDGYIYATAGSAQHLGLQNHYTYNSIFIIALRNYLLQGNNRLVKTEDGIVDIMDTKNSSNQTMRDRLEKAMSYMLTALEGESGVLTINDPRNDGTVNGVSSNYWDVYKSFGYKSAYENTLYYASLLAYADIQKMYGKDAEAQKFIDLAAKTKEKFNQLFWDASKGRYITSINVEGKRIDHGMTYVNFMACKYGLADEQKGKLIYSWLDGKRIIEGDTSTGDDIYGEYIYAARSNTIDAYNVKDDNGIQYWFDHYGALPCAPGTFGGYGHQMQNGGTIFYISYYDIVGRIKTNDIESANKRFNIIMDEFHKDSLRRNRYLAYTQDNINGVGEYSEGVLGEFPESGLVPYSFIEGFLGITPERKGLKISPKLPNDLEYAGIREYIYGNQKYSIQVSKQIDNPIIQKDDEKIFVALPANKTYYITLDGRLEEGE